MKLFELYESPILTGSNNLKSIANAATTGSSAAILLGDDHVTLEHPEARYIYGLYKQSLKDGRQDQFMRMLSDPSSFDSLMTPMRNMLYRDRGSEMAQATGDRLGQAGMEEAHVSQEAPIVNDNTLKHIVGRFPLEIKEFFNGADLNNDLYTTLFDYYHMHGEMPYSIRTGERQLALDWVKNRFGEDATPYLPENISESKKAQVKEESTDNDWWGWDEPKKTSSGTVYKTSSGTVHKGKYGSEYQGDDDEDDDEVKTPASEPKSKGRPSAAVKKTDSGETISDYRLWYHKSKRLHPERKIVGSATKAIAVIPKGKKFAVVGSWGDNQGSINASAGETMSADQLAVFKSAKGRPKKIREFIENLRYVVESKDIL